MYKLLKTNFDSEHLKTLIFKIHAGKIHNNKFFKDVNGIINIDTSCISPIDITSVKDDLYERYIFYNSNGFKYLLIKPK